MTWRCEAIVTIGVFKRLKYHKSSPPSLFFSGDRRLISSILFGSSRRNNHPKLVEYTINASEFLRKETLVPLLRENLSHRVRFVSEEPAYCRLR